ncbi:MAG: hypothetical protein ACOC1O_00705 [bacterium]
MKNNDIMELERKIMICKCESPEHQVLIWYDEEDGDFYCEPHLTTHRNFFQRLWYGLKYAFGYKSKYGSWDEMIFKEEDLKELRDFLIEKLEDENN